MQKMICVFLLVLMLAACAVKPAPNNNVPPQGQNPPTQPAAQSSPPQEQIPPTQPAAQNSPPQEQNPPQQPSGQGNPPPGQNNAPQNPFSDNTYYATSPDGINWSEGKLLAERASVPDVLYSSKGEFRAYWVDFTNMKKAGDEKIGVAISADGVNWEMSGFATFIGADGLVPVDPNVKELPDGRFRIYFFDIADKSGMNKIYSAISSDGINFTLEDGVRFQLDKVYDPNVIPLPDGRLRMYLNQRNIISATSADGVNFTQDDGIRIEKGGVPGAIIRADGKILLYACTNGISVYESADGLDFTLLKSRAVTEGNDLALVCDPAVAAYPGGYLMVYKGKPK